MSDAKGTTDFLKTTPVALSLVGAVVVLLLWYLAFYSPQNHNIAKLKSDTASLQQEIIAGNQQLAINKTYSKHVSTYTSKRAKLQGYVPTKPGTTAYLLTLTTLAKTAHVSILSLLPKTYIPVKGLSAPTTTTTAVPVSTTTTSKTTAATATTTTLTARTTAPYLELPIDLIITGSYDHILKYITLLYKLPRLTDIQKISIRNGGTTTNRTTILQATLTILIFQSVAPITATTTTTTG